MMSKDNENIIEKINRLEKRIERLENRKNPYLNYKKINPYDLSEVVKLRDRKQT